ncbi:MAG TPA: sulfite oxidase [Bryobacteraceae bacterium]|nr:sulfite oxidase [Bryobacteraceae bacterium]
MRSVLNRRTFLTSAAAMAAPRFLWGFAGDEDGTPIPFLDTPPPNPERTLLQWDQLRSWITPTADFFSVAHYDKPEPAGENWRLDIAGLVQNAKSLALEDLKARPRREYTATLECSGNGASPTFVGGIGNARWAGTPLAPVLTECGLRSEAIEVVFFGADHGTEKIRGKDYPQNFARSLSRLDALKDNVLLAYEMNGEPLSHAHGGPVRLVVPGWYGIAWAKWLTRIELHDRRFMGRFMARDYVTIRGEQHGDQMVWRETSVGKMNLKSFVARVVRRADGTLRVSGAAWNDGSVPIRSVELKIDDKPWAPAELKEGRDSPHAWKFWSYDWRATAGEHTLVSRASDAAGRVQPAGDDPVITMKKTYWEANQQYPRRIKI